MSRIRGKQRTPLLEVVSLCGDAWLVAQCHPRYLNGHGQCRNQITWSEGASKGQEWRNEDVDDAPHYHLNPFRSLLFLWVINFKRHWCIQKKTPRAFLFIIGTWIISTIIVLQQGLGNCCNTSKNYDSTLKSSRGLPTDHGYPTCPIPELLQLLFPKKPCALQSCHPQYTPVSAVLIRRTLSKVDFA